jgi:transcriptional regulator with XRE-family HTH domain
MMPSRRDKALDLEIGARVRFARTRIGMSQAELGRRLGYMSGSTLWRYEEGVRGLTKTQLIVLAAELDVSTDWLLTGVIRIPRAKRRRDKT